MRHHRKLYDSFRHSRSRNSIPPFISLGHFEKRNILPFKSNCRLLFLVTFSVFCFSYGRNTGHLVDLIVIEENFLTLSYMNGNIISEKIQARNFFIMITDLIRREGFGKSRQIKVPHSGWQLLVGKGLKSFRDLCVLKRYWLLVYVFFIFSCLMLFFNLNIFLNSTILLLD